MLHRFSSLSRVLPFPNSTSTVATRHVVKLVPQWADKTLEINAGLYSGGELARSLTMHAREGGVKFESIDAAICEAALVKVMQSVL